MFITLYAVHTTQTSIVINMNGFRTKSYDRTLLSIAKPLFVDGKFNGHNFSLETNRFTAHHKLRYRTKTFNK